MLSEEGGSGSSIFHLIVLIYIGLGVLVLPRIIAAKLLGDLVSVNIRFEVLDTVREVDLRGDDGVQPALNKPPNTCMLKIELKFVDPGGLRRQSDL